MSKLDEKVKEMRKEVDEKYKELIRAKNREIQKLIVSYEYRMCAVCKHLNKGCTLNDTLKGSGCGLFEGTRGYTALVEKALK